MSYDSSPLWPNLQTVMMRELMREARSPAASCFRALGCLGLLAMLGLVALSPTGIPLGDGSGGRLFLEFNLAVFSLIWVAVPFFSYDAISRERREGTLELLFLAPLGAFEVLAAKGFVHVLRAVVWMLAMLPVMMVPLLVGGVAYLDVLRMVLLQGAAILLALLAGLIASVHSRSALQSAIWALVGSLGFLTLFGATYVLGSALLFIERSGIHWTREGIYLVVGFFFRSAWNRLPFNRPGVALGIASYQSDGGGATWEQVAQAGTLFITTSGGVLLGFFWLARRLKSVVRSEGECRSYRERPVRINRLRMRGLRNDRWWRIWLQLRYLMRRYHCWRRAVLALAAMAVLGVYWVYRFGGQEEVLLVKWVLLTFVLGVMSIFWIVWLIREERHQGGLELLLTVPEGARVYVPCLLGVAMLPTVPAALVLLTGLYWLTHSELMVMNLALLLGNAGLIAFVLAWRFQRATVVVLGVCVFLGGVPGWALYWNGMHSLASLPVGVMQLGIVVASLLAVWAMVRQGGGLLARLLWD
ncbi:MAG: hypothetical protein M2R45_01876 [Verrucomicrobia subdivision 3 bacterium]|nr:hypothetical protein [Limisphaerales bacterium]MCS1415676.1 hypothetical protein [Limisphaerales bacterium]